MTLPVGTISMSQVNTELGLSSTTLISLNQTSVRTLAGAPSGTISMNDLRGKTFAFPQFNNASTFDYAYFYYSGAPLSPSINFLSDGTITYTGGTALISGPTAYSSATGAGVGSGMEISVQVTAGLSSPPGPDFYTAWSFAGVTYGSTATTPFYALGSTRTLTLNAVNSGVMSWQIAFTVTVRKTDDTGAVTRTGVLTIEDIS
jgi:hypothetical protein